MEIQLEKTIEEEKTRTRAISVLLLAVFIDILGFGIIIPLLPFWVTSLGAAELVFGLILAIYSLFQFIFAPLWGRLSDRIGRRPVVLAGLTGTVIGFSMLLVASVFINSIEMLVLSRIVGGIFTSATLPTSQAYVSDVSTSEERAKYFGYIGAAMGLGFAFGPAIGGFLTAIARLLTPSLNGYWAPALFATGIAMTNAMAGFRFLPESLTEEKRSERSELKASEGSASSFEILRTIGKRPVILLVFALFAALNLSMYIFEATMPLLGMSRIELDETQLGIGFMIAGIIMILTQGSLIGPLSTRFSDTMLIAAGLFIFMMSFLGLSTIDSFLVLIIWLLPFAFGFSITQPTLGALLSKNSPNEKLGAIMGMNEGITALMRVFGPLIGALLYTVDMVLPFYIGAGTLAASIILALILQFRVNNTI
ncbi:MAG: MFS transporter [Candidatus Thorarchaeota archaeon]